MNDAHFDEIARTLAMVADARACAASAAETIAATGGDAHVVEAMWQLEAELAELRQDSMRRTALLTLGSREPGAGRLFEAAGDQLTLR